MNHGNIIGFILVYSNQNTNLADKSLETWIGWRDIPPSADWLAEVYEAIEQA